MTPGSRIPRSPMFPPLQPTGRNRIRRSRCMPRDPGQPGATDRRLDPCAAACVAPSPACRRPGGASQSPARRCPVYARVHLQAEVPDRLPTRTRDYILKTRILERFGCLRPFRAISGRPRHCPGGVMLGAKHMSALVAVQDWRQMAGIKNFAVGKLPSR